MNARFPHTTTAALLVLFILLHLTSVAFSQGTTFTYQGRLTDNGAPYSGSAEFQPTLWDAASGGTQVAANNPATLIGGLTNGLFVLPLDFGANFPGADRWLQLEVRTTIGNFTVLAPRQKLTPAPYALATGQLTGALPASQLSGVIPSVNVSGAYANPVSFENAGNNFTGSGAGLTLLDASQLTAGTVPDARLSANVARADQVWLRGGNAATTPGTHFVGTTDHQPLEFKVNNERVLRLEFNTNLNVLSSPSPNLISGHPSNQVASGVSGATIAGGGGTNWFGATSPQNVGGDFSTIGGGIGNEVQGVVSAIAGGERGFIGSNAFNAFIGGGAWNTIHAPDSVIGGGRFNVIQTNTSNAVIGGGSNNTNSAHHATIGGGVANTASGLGNVVGGGFNNSASDSYSVVGGGSGNIGNGAYATVPGGLNNSAAGMHSFAAGRAANASHSGSFVWADNPPMPASFSSTANNQFAVRATGGALFVANMQIGTGNGDYRQLRMGGGNSAGFLYGSFPALGDGIHLSYNHFYNAGGSGQVINAGGASSRVSVSYGTVQLAVGGVGSAPTTQRLLANSTGVTVNGTFNNSSDRNTKQDFAPVYPAQILEKVAQLPISQWSYKEDAATRHIGPMAQDFRAAFGVGTDDKHIAPLDEGGVALAAIQGLNLKLEDRNRRSKARSQWLEEKLEQKETEIAELKRTVNELKELVQAMNHKLNGAAQ